MKKRYIIEPRNSDGTLDAKRIGCFESEFSFNTLNVTEEELFQDYFQKHPKKQLAQWEEVRDWLRGKGLMIREKTW